MLCIVVGITCCFGVVGLFIVLCLAYWCLVAEWFWLWFVFIVLLVIVGIWFGNFVVVCLSV